MTKEIVGCTRCGWVARADLLETAEPTCADCGGPLRQMELAYARRLVGARRRADKRRSDQAKASQVGLDAAEPARPQM
jgi:hypothetical protein